ncbi:MAG TPA: acyltransferase family protein, partial [Rubricoccaceae bacterium]
TGRFWGRRWLRTVPAYLVALHAVFAAKWALSGGTLPYDPRYLLFVQNYEAHLPYWAVSWSLCVEEHFYLALPFALGAALRSRFGMDALLAVALVASVVARVLTVDPGDPLYGLHYTMTHTRMEGLVLGVWASFVYHRRPARWPALERAARLAVGPGLLLVAAVPLLPLDVLNRYGFTVVDLAFAAVLVAVVARPPLPGATSRAVQAAALASYSVYMTHTVALEMTERVAAGLPVPLHVAVGLATVAAVGAAFYAAVERPSLWIRERLLPARVPSVSLAPIALSP